MIAYNIRQLPTTESTNAEAKSAAVSGAPEGLVVHALEQTAGLGRQGRTWDSPKGNLYASVLLRPHCSPQEAGAYSFAAALAVCDAVREHLPQASVQIKWPNDILANGKKLCGILLEAAPANEGIVEWLVIGIGLNVRHYPENAFFPATSFKAEGGGEISVQAVLDSVLRAFERWRETLKNKGFGAVRAAWVAKAKKGQITARLPHETVEGDFEDVDATGNLVLRLADGRKRSISAADVFFSS